MTCQRLWNVLERAERQRTRFASGRFKDLPRHAFSEVAATALSTPQNLSMTFLEVVVTGRVPFWRQFGATEALLAVLCKVEGTLAGALQEELHHVRPVCWLLMTPLHQRLVAGEALGLTS